MKQKPVEDVVYLIPEERSRSVLNRSQLYWIFFLLSITLFFLLCGGWYLNKSILVIRVVTEKKDSLSCSGISNVDKFDCYPEGGANEENCQKRGCCFNPKPKSFPPLNVPYCYYPSDYKGYTISNVTQDGKEIKASLTRNTLSGFPLDVSKVQLIITFIDDCKLRIKLTDPSVERFEVPIPINAEPQKLKNPCYSVELDSKTGQLKISRKSTGTVIFKTNLSQMVYSDQFLQLSSYLPSHNIYGIGEHYGSFLKSTNWTRLTLLNSDRAPVPNYPLYGSQPFYLSLEKGGQANGVFLLNSNIMDVVLQPTPAITFRPIGGILDFFVMLGPSPADVVQQYTDLVGRTFMPPYWSLGFHLCRYGYNSLNKTRETMQRTLDAGIPLDVQWNDIDYMDRYKDFTYDEKNFEGLPEFVDELHSKGMHYVIMTDPGISNAEKAGTYPPYDEGLTSDVFIKNPNGSLFVGKVWTDAELVFPDFSHPNATAYWTKQFTDFYTKVKYDGVWIDMNEPSNFYDGEKDGCMASRFEDPYYLPGGQLPLRRKTVCMTAKHYNSMHYNEHNLYAHREATATNAALKSVLHRRPFIISRASFSGQGVQSGHWSGDIGSTWEDMRYTIPSLLNFNLYGMSMIGSDICGFNGNTTVPLCARWQALGAFYPFSRNHNERDTIEQDPVSLGPTVVDATKNALMTRYMILPYLYTLFYRSHIFGETVVRPLFFEFPSDEKTHSIDEQFMLGPGFMVIPVLYEGAENVSAYYPAGYWYGGAGAVIKSHGETLTLQIPITSIGFSVRGGYLLPGQLPALNTAQSRENPFLLISALDETGAAVGELYWDDGDSLDTYTKGNYNLIQFKIQNNTLTSTVVKSGYNSSMALGGVQVAGIQKQPAEVKVNDVKCSEQPHEDLQHEMVLIGQSRVVEYVQELNSTSPFCVFDFIPPRGLTVGTNGFSLTSPLSVTWS